MSTAFYKSIRKPQLVASFIHQQKSVSVWTTTCIVNNFGKSQDETLCNVLINPSNPELSGVSNFPYFPRLSCDIIYVSELKIFTFGK